MAQTSVDEQLLGARLREEKKKARRYNSNKSLNDNINERMKIARKQMREANIKEKKRALRLGKKAVATAKKKIARGSNAVFFILLILAISVDLMEYSDAGLFSAFSSMGIYVLTVIGLFFVTFIKSSNTFSITRYLRGQLWKYMVLPIFEFFPLINLIPFWTGTVILMWFKVSRERRKLINREKEVLRKSQLEYV